MLWLKLIHLFLVISFMAGVFYLPRILVHYKMAQQQGQDLTRLIIMARKLYNFSLITGSGSLLSGLALVYYFYSFSFSWVWYKIIAVAFLLIYFFIAGLAAIKLMPNKKLPGSHIFWRLYNEFSVVFLLVILYLIIFKP